VGSQLPSWPARLRFTKWVSLVEHDLWSRRTTIALTCSPCFFCVCEQRVETVQVLGSVHRSDQLHTITLSST
jgi:hypothetical protein